MRVDTLTGEDFFGFIPMDYVGGRPIHGDEMQLY